MKKIINFINNYKWQIWVSLFIIGLLTTMFIDEIIGTYILATGAGSVLLFFIVISLVAFIKWIKTKIK